MEFSLWIANSFDGGDGFPIHFKGRKDTGVDGLAIKDDRAGPTLSHTASLFGSMKAQPLSQQLQKGEVGFHLHLDGFSIQNKSDGLFHGFSFFMQKQR
jgi:hypothetical protein